MGDLLVVGAVSAFFLVTLGLMAVCDRLRGG
jgi:hypothetical protein